MNGAGGSASRFSETAPRPPVFPGEENVLHQHHHHHHHHQQQQQHMLQQQLQLQLQQQLQGRMVGEAQWAAQRRRSAAGGVLAPTLASPSKGSSPVLTPRRHQGVGGVDAEQSDHNQHHQLHHNQSLGSSSSSLVRRYEPAEGSASTSPPLAETPPYLRWAENLHYLLADPDGVELFEKYLQIENCSHLLKFWFACEGLKRQWVEEPGKALQIINLIHKKYIRPRKVHVSELVRKGVNDLLANHPAAVDAHVFDAAQKEVEDLVRDSAYANFLNSDVYLNYIQSMQNGASDSPRSSRSQGNAVDLKAAAGAAVGDVVDASAAAVGLMTGAGVVGGGGGAGMLLLPTVHEEAELQTGPNAAAMTDSGGGVKALPLTSSMLLATEKKRALMNYEVRPMPGHFAGRLVQHPYHLPPHAPYNPVSRQDSEIQSLSSDAHTDDNRSLTDSSVDGASAYYKPSRSQQRRMQQKMKSNALQNRDPGIHQTVIPRTQRMLPKEQQMLQQQQPHEFAALLIQKLEAVKRERDLEDKLNRKISERERESDLSGMESDAAGCPVRSGPVPRPGSECTARDLAEALSKIAACEADTQSILDNHVQRIWSDQTPLRSPGVPSPRPWSPEMNRRRAMVVVNPSSMAGQKMAGVGGVGGASGASLPPGSSYGGSASYFQRPTAYHRRKDKDAAGSTFSADSGAALEMADLAGAAGGGYLPKSQSVPDARRVLPAAFTVAAGLPCGVSGVKKADFGDSGLCLTDTSCSSLMAPPPVPCKEKVLHWIMNNDKCQDSGAGSDSGAGAAASKLGRSRPPSSTSPISSRRSRKQPSAYNASRSESLERGGAAGDVADEMAAAAAARNRPSTRPKPAPLAAASVSTLAGQLSAMHVAPHAPPECTVVTFTFGDEPVPYRSKIAGRTVTLRQFKDILPKKGNYKYYFKTNCEDDVALAVFQEVMDEQEVLPLWEDKVLGLVKLID